MKIWTIIAFLFAFNISQAKTYFVPICKNQFPDSITLKAGKLKQLYLLSTASSKGVNDIYKQQFFDEFPDTFEQLNELYGYNNTKAAPLYYEAEKHILNLFNNLNGINDTAYYKKIISLAMDGRWDADAVNYFQMGLRRRVLDAPALIVYILKDMPDKKIKSFWFFYFDGAIVKKHIAEPLQKIKDIDNRIYGLMIEAQNQALNQPK